MLCTLDDLFTYMCCGIALSAEIGRFWGQRHKVLVQTR